MEKQFYAVLAAVFSSDAESLKPQVKAAFKPDYNFKIARVIN